MKITTILNTIIRQTKDAWMSTTHTNAMIINKLSKILGNGCRYRQIGRLQHAEAFYWKFFGHTPDHPETLNLLGLLAQSNKEIQTGLKS